MKKFFYFVCASLLFSYVAFSAPLSVTDLNVGNTAKIKNANITNAAVSGSLTGSGSNLTGVVKCTNTINGQSLCSDPTVSSILSSQVSYTAAPNKIVSTSPTSTTIDPNWLNGVLFSSQASYTAAPNSIVMTSPTSTVIDWRYVPFMLYSSGSNSLTIGDPSITDTYIPGGLLHIGTDIGGGNQIGVIYGTNYVFNTQNSDINSSARNNVFIGRSSGLDVVDSEDDVYIGNGSGQGVLHGIENTAIGSLSLQAENAGANAVVGFAAAQVVTGSYNTVMGSQAFKQGSASTNEKSVSIGFNSSPLNTSGTNEIIIGYSTTGNGSNTSTIGNGSITDAYLSGTLHSSAITGITSTAVVTNLNSDMVDGYHAGNSSGNVPVSNGTVNTNLNADLLDGHHAADFTFAGHALVSSITDTTTFTSGGVVMSLPSITTTIGDQFFVVIDSTCTKGGTQGSVRLNLTGADLGGGITSSWEASLMEASEEYDKHLFYLATANDISGHTTFSLTRYSAVSNCGSSSTTMSAYQVYKQ